MPESGMPGWYARRALLRSAVFDSANHQVWSRHHAIATSVATGVIAEVRDEALVLDSGRGGTESFALSPATVTWLGAPTTPSALRSGDPVIVRHRAADAAAPERRCAERIWSRIGRVTGMITAADGREFLVDTGHGAARRVVVPTAAARQIQVRFPRLAPGYLLDVIGTRHGDYLLAVTPATAQPPYRAGQAPGPPRVSGSVQARISGSAVWHEPGDEPAGLLGVGYPALDREPGALPPGARFADGGAGCVRLPYLSLGAAVWIRNECTDRAAVLPVTGDGAMARQFCDRCLDCGTSPKGRVADLTMAAFVELGGSLEDGCFNAMLSTDLGLTGPPADRVETGRRGLFVSGASVLDIAREVQVPLIAALLIGGFAAKARRAVISRSVDAGTGPTAMLPLRLRRPAALALCAAELALGAGLVLTAGRAGAGAPALVFRVATVLLFGIATAALHELRERRPAAGCGCFGEFSRTPVSWRVIARSALLWAAALSSVGAQPLRMPDSAGQAWLILGVAAAELAVLAALSPEVGQVMIQLSHTDPCEVREVPVARTLSVLRASWPWRQFRPFLAADAPVDVWREGCWRFVVYPGRLDGRRVDVVFAVYLAGRRAPVRIGILEAGIDFADLWPEPIKDPLQLSNHV